MCLRVSNLDYKGLDLGCDGCGSPDDSILPRPRPKPGIETQDQSGSSDIFACTDSSLPGAATSIR